MTVEPGRARSSIVNASDQPSVNVVVPIQGVLPHYRSVVRANDERLFAHPAELELARVFDFFGVRWAYEPTSFTLPPQGDARQEEWFTPDFYLPDHRLYIELTTMRQRLVTRKNQKVRRLAEAYPNVRIKLIYRRDYLRLMHCFRGAVAQRPDAGSVRVLLTPDEIDRRVAEIAFAFATKVDAEARMSAARRLTLLALGRGALPLQAGLKVHLEKLGFIADIQRIGLACRQSPDSRARIWLRRQTKEALLTGDPIILITDVVSTGLSLAYVQDRLRRLGARSLLTCTLLDRPVARLMEPSLDASVFTAPNDVLVGFGLQLNPHLASLPYIGVLTSNSTLDVDGMLDGRRQV